MIFFHGGDSALRLPLKAPLFTALSEKDAEWYANNFNDPTIYRFKETAPLNLMDDRTHYSKSPLLGVAQELGLDVQGDSPDEFYCAEIEKHAQGKASAYNQNDLVYIPEVRRALIMRGYDGVRCKDTLENTEIDCVVFVDTKKLQLISKKKLDEQTSALNKKTLETKMKLTKLAQYVTESELKVVAYKIPLAKTKFNPFSEELCDYPEVVKSFIKEFINYANFQKDNAGGEVFTKLSPKFTVHKTEFWLYPEDAKQSPEDIKDTAKALSEIWEDFASDHVHDEANDIVDSMWRKLADEGVHVSKPGLKALFLGGGQSLDTVIRQLQTVGYEDGWSSYEDNKEFFSQYVGTKADLAILSAASR